MSKDRPGGRLTTGRKYLFALVTCLLALGCLAGIGELYLRLSGDRVYLERLTYLQQRLPNPMQTWAVSDAFCAYRGKPGDYPVSSGDDKKTVNAHGFVSTPPIEPVKPPGTIRVVFLGGSSTAGMGHNLADRATWPWQTMELFREAFPGVELDFINAALGGYSSFESYGRLWSRLRFFDPDVVVVYHGWNEMYYFGDWVMERIASWRTFPDGSWSLDRPAILHRRYEPLAIDDWIRWSQLLSHLRVRLTRPNTGEVVNVREWGDGPAEREWRRWDRRSLEVWRSNLRLLRETATVIGAELFVAKQATLLVPGLVPQERERCRLEYHGFDFDQHLEAYQELYRVIDEEIQADRIIDTTVLSGRPELFHDHVHPTEEGGAALAQVMSEELGSYLEEQLTGSKRERMIFP